MNKTKNALGLNISVFLMMLGVGMIVAIIPQRIIQLTGSNEAVNYLAAVFGISYILFQIPIGYWSDRVGFKFFLIAGYVLCFIAGLFYYFANNPWNFLLARFIQGAGEAPIWALAPALLSIQFADVKGKVIGIYNAVIHIGLTIGPLLGIVLAKLLVGNLPFMFYTVVCLLGAIVIIFRVDNIKGANNQANLFDFRNITRLLSAKNSFVTLMGIIFYGAGYGLFLTTIPAFLLSGKAFNQTIVGIYFCLFYVSISLSQLITGVLSDKMGRKFFMILGLLVASAGIMCFPGLDGILTIGMLTLGSLGLGIFYLSSMAFLNDVVPHALKGTISGAYYLFWGIGFFFGPVFIGKLGEQISYRAGFQIFAMIILVQAVLMLRFVQRDHLKSSTI